MTPKRTSCHCEEPSDEAISTLAADRRRDLWKKIIFVELFFDSAPLNSRRIRLNWNRDTTIEPIERLYREHGPAILGYLRAAVGQAESAQDLLQQTFLQALRSADRFEEVFSPRAWLFGIARKTAANYIRRRPSFAPLPQQLSANCSPQDPRIETMRQAITKLPAAQRETLELRIGHDLSYQEIAAVLEIPLGTVRSRLHSAVSHLRRIMQNDV